MKTLIITQARYGSSRLPGKVLKKIGTQTLLDVHLKRLKTSTLASQVMVATTFEAEAEDILAIARENSCLSFKGDLNDVLDRFYQSARSYGANVVVRVTSDCPLNEGAEIDVLLKAFFESDIDYLSNIHPPTFPDGVDIEIFTFSALERAWKEGREKKEREHVTPYIWGHPEIFRMKNVRQDEDMSQFRLTVDTSEDFDLVSKLFLALGTERPWRDYVEHLKRNPDLLKINGQFLRNEGF